VRLSGAEPGVRAAAAKIGGTRLDGAEFWRGVREHTHAFFSAPEPLWRIAVPSVRPPLGLPGETLIEWAGGLRWWRGVDGRKAGREAGGHATLFRSEGARQGVFEALDPVLMGLHRRLKAAFDPAGILNPGRLYPEL
jgi:glycolate oxidase FAD binding subunit